MPGAWGPAAPEHRAEPRSTELSLERFVRTVSQVTTRYGRPLKYADLRHADGYALRLEGVSTTVAAAPKAGARPHN